MFSQITPDALATYIVGGATIAAMVIPEDAARYAEKCGMFVIGQVPACATGVGSTVPEGSTVSVKLPVASVPVDREMFFAN